MVEYAVKMKNVIVYLIRGTESSLKGFERSVELLTRNFLPWSPADVIVFHEGNLDVEEVNGRLRRKGFVGASELDPSVISGLKDECRLKFLKVDFSGVPKELEAVPPQKRGYRHMCHFFANDIFNRPELADYRYQMRLDDDSFILSPLKFNVFKEMSRGGYKYGYRAIVKDKAPVCEGLWPTAERYFATNGCVRSFASIKHLGMYYTNFEICDLQWFRADAWQNFFKAIDEAAGIWTARWGDAPIRYLGVQGLLGDDQIRQFNELHYFHQSEWRAGFSRRLPWDLAKYYLWVIKCLIRLWLCRA